MYLDTMQQIYGNVTKVLVESRQGNSMLYLPLDKILQMNAAPQGEAASTPAAAQPAAPAAPVLNNDARSRDAARSRDRDSR
jgi:membrane protease subunit HflK